ncbi:MAG: tRNA pseudouridine(13) synthase TruD, partial [Marinicella sp.]
MQKFNQLFPSLNPVNGTGVIRTKPSDFKVTEHNELSFTGEGEHLWLLVKKTNSNTAWAATQLASACKVPARQVGFAGLKDRHAITKQWFSVQLPKIKELNEIKAKLPTELQIIDHQWHKSKIKTGYLSWNEFELVIRQVVADKTQIDQNIKTIKAQGVPNYFGAQRFGHNMNNI